jgi:hypothetical protein
MEPVSTPEKVGKDLHLEKSEELRRWWVALITSKDKSHQKLAGICQRVARIEFLLSR